MRLILSIIAGCAAAGLAAAQVPTVVVGTGSSMIVEYDRDLKEIRRYQGLQKPVDVTPIGDGALLVVDELAREVLAFDRDGRVLLRHVVSDVPLRARPTADGGLLLVVGDHVVALDREQRERWRWRVENLRAVVPLENGNFVTAHNSGSGFLSEWKPDGELIWRSPPRGHTDASGTWIPGDPERSLGSVWSLDVSSDGSLFTSDFDAHKLRLLSPDRGTARIWAVPGMPHVVDTRYGPNGERVATSPEGYQVRVERPDGTSISLRPELRPYCANLTPEDTLVVGLLWEPEAARTAKRYSPPSATWHERPEVLSALGFALAAALVVVARGRAAAGALAARAAAVRRERWNGLRLGRLVGQPAPGLVAPSLRRSVVVGVSVATWIVASCVAWVGLTRLLRGGHASGGTWWFLAGSLLAGAGLRVAGGLLGSHPTLDGLREVPGPVAAPGGRWTPWLIAGSLTALATSLALLLWAPQLQAPSIAAWVMAQVLGWGAAYAPAVANGPARGPRLGVVAVLAVMLAVGALTRFWDLAFYPDHIHHDHSIFGHAALETWRGGWRPFFVMDPWSGATVARPWLATTILGFELFGVHYWVLRLTSAASGVALVAAAYLFGRAFFNRRVGLIGAFLVLANAVLWIHARQPYILDSAPFFLLALACAAEGMRSGNRLVWSLAGFFSGWSMLTIRSFTLFPLVGAVVFVYAALAHPQRLWRHRRGLAWMVFAAVTAYLPMVPHMLESVTLQQRLSTQLVLLHPDGSMNLDADLWRDQVGRSFGAIVSVPDSSSWGIATGRPICIGVEAVLFGVGLGYLLLSWPLLGLGAVMASLVVGIFLGSAVLSSPPTYYHFLFAIVPIEIVAAIGLDRSLALTDGWRLRFGKIAASSLAALVLAFVAYQQWTAFREAVRRPPDREGQNVYRADVRSMIARTVRESPDDRYYLVRTQRDVSAADPSLLFFADDSDVSDLTRSLPSVLPLQPTGDGRDVALLVLPSRASDGDQIVRTYPGARQTELLLAAGQSLRIYRVEEAELRRVYQQAGD